MSKRKTSGASQSLLGGDWKRRKHVHDEDDPPAVSVGSKLDRFSTNTAPAEILGRDKELSVIEEFLCGCLKAKQGGGLYISGAPGTGKSASVKHVIHSKVSAWEKKMKMIHANVVEINAMSCSNPNQLYASIFEKLHLPVPDVSSLKGEMQKLFTMKSRKMTILVLDEIDGLLDSSRTVLYNFFELCAMETSTLVLIGIANALDLTHRFLPLLKRKKIAPELLTFPSYSKGQIELILRGRFLAADQALDDSALKLICAKAAGCGGDMRKALELCRMAISDASRENNPGLANTVKFQHVAKSASKLMGSKHAQVIKKLPQHQQIVLCVAQLLLKDFPQVTCGELLDYYKEKAKFNSLPEVSSSELSEILSSLCEQGLLEFRGKQQKNIRTNKIKLLAVGSDIEAALSDAPFYKMVNA
jgi:cell division control protein 6